MEKNQGKAEAAERGVEETSACGLTWGRRVPLFDSPSQATCGTSPAPAGAGASVAKITRDAEDMLVKARRKPHLVLTALYEELGFSGYKGGKSKYELIRAGLVEEVELPTNRRGRRKKLLQVTPKGNEYLRVLGVTDGPPGRGGVRHYFYQKALKDWYEAKGYTVEVEATVGGVCVDVLVIGSDGTRLALEVALSEQYEGTKARKAFEAGLERLLFVCETKEMLEKVQRKLAPVLEKWPGRKPGFKLISDYLVDD